MPQLIGVVIVIYILAWVVAGIVWICQWIGAAIYWVWEVALMPFIIYLTPATLTILVVIGLFWGGGIAIRNYLASLRNNVNSNGNQAVVAKYTRYYLLSTLSIFLVAIYMVIVAASAFLVYAPSEKFVYHVIDYYDTIEFPAYTIKFPFWNS